MKDVKFKTDEWNSLVNGVNSLQDLDIVTLVRELGTISTNAIDSCDQYDVDNYINIQSMDGVLVDDLDERIAKLAQKTFTIQDTLPADIDQPFYDSMDSLIEKLSNMNIMGYETMARGSFSNGVNSVGVAMPKMKVTLEDLLGNNSPLTDYLRVEYNQMKQQIGDVSFEDYKKMSFADNSFDYYSRNEKVKDLAVTVVINGAVLVIGGTLPWPIMVTLGLTSGGKNISDAWRGKDLFTGKKLSTGDRILRGLSGVADVALAGYGTYKGLRPRKGTTKVVVSEKNSGTNISKPPRNLVDNMDEIADDIRNINKKYSSGFEQNNSIENIINSASYYEDSWEQASAVTRSITDHAFVDGNKRTAFDTLNMLLDDLKLNSPLKDSQKWDLINKIGTGDLKDVSEIANILKGK